MNGLTKNIAMASAIGMNFIAAKKRDVAVRINEALIKCSKISPLVGQYKIFKNNAMGMIIMD
tara:strand:+ start:745 stop:930 length:186 start_codon:yes stop_codon:yes gene_type:complete